MKTLYIDCGMGAAGDMLTAALLELLQDQDSIIERLNKLDIPGVQIKRERIEKCGILGTHVSVTVGGYEEESADIHHSHQNEEQPQKHHTHHHHHYSGMHVIEHIIGHLHIPPEVQEDVINVYKLIAQAESHVHGVPVNEIHFHEVGAMDAIADITNVCMLMHELAPEEVIVSPVHVGSGQVHCAHGILPVPAPATAHILRNVPIYSGNIIGELCTPTGAALLKHFATRFDSMPAMKVSSIGYGMGKKNFEAANCVRAMLGETLESSNTVLELSCNVDDMTAEAIAFAAERFFEEGALEVYTIPIGMKKSRPGTLIRVMCREEDRELFISLIFKHTTTIGIRETLSKRYVLNRNTKTIHTPYGDVRRKDSNGYGITRSKYEYDDLARIAKENGLSIEDVQSGLHNTLPL